MLNLSQRYRQFLSFATSKDKDIIPQRIFWAAVIITFSIANAPPDRIYKIILEVLQPLIPVKLLLENSYLKQDYSFGQKAVNSNIIIPLKEFIFFLAFLVIAYPILRSLWKSKSLWDKFEIKKTAISALGFFLVLSLLAFPYAYPYGLNPHRSGLAGIGRKYGLMSLEPFTSNDAQIYRRLLKPALAHFIQMDGYILYYLFSLICTYFLIFMTLAFIESKILENQTFDENKRNFLDPKGKFLIYLSVMTSSYMMVSFQWPGYPEQLAFILILLMAFIPMTYQGRLGTIALCMLTHDGTAFALVPIILWCFPKKERGKALLVVSLFFVIWLASYGLDLHQGLEAYYSVGGELSNWEAVTRNPGLTLAGVFFSYKLFWIVFLYVVWRLWSYKDKATLVGIVTMIVFPVFTLLLAWDATRLTGFGFLGMLITLSILIHEYKQLPIQHYYVLLAIIWINIFIPSYNIVLEYQDSLANYPYPGLYMLIHRVFSYL